MIFVLQSAAMPLFCDSCLAKFNPQTPQWLCGLASMKGTYRAVEMAHAHKPMLAINAPHSKARAKVSLAGVDFEVSRRGRHRP
jgi:hypothetical protein